ncbi:LD-carboxypeptidase [Aquibium sp. ELW1220]|uniref:S66 peptidase family protein n=1 Tax=Aquibium sp. ELW1220 TaxID=2976766 RepID=UPI0025AF8D5A|nr:LD-carboxypeptidase [Aquibium sp. ELW1220]MDN2578745.1 LD-carboxypeptidase [Aquibium sp. ELW1220]
MRLKPGDLVCIVAPASQFRGADSDLLSAAVSLLQSWHLQVDVRVDDTHHFYLAGPDGIRASHLNSALVDDRIRAIFCTRGGYGSARLLRHLDSDLSPARKLLVGHSDITTLHLAAASFWPNIISIHGPNIATRQLLDDTRECELNRRSLHTAIFCEEPVVEPIEFLRAGRARGLMIGGCLSLVAAALGTNYAPHFSESIVFLEDTGEPPYRIDRMLTQLRSAGVFESARAVVFGAMTNCTDPYNDLRSVIQDLLGDYSFPIAYGFRSGHGKVNLSLRLGTLVELSCEPSVIRIYPTDKMS